MAFYPNDFYCSGGGKSVDIENYWTPNVYKFDTSTFYNWEQDNEPIYDLEDRTNHLWEKAGFPTSTIPGVSYVVSGAAPAAAPNHNNVFTTLSGAIAALPDTIRFPVRIEVCTSSIDGEIAGRIGDLQLKNIRFTDRGCLEIINRWFAKPLSQNPVGAAYILAGAATLGAGDVPNIAAFRAGDVSSLMLETSCIAAEAALGESEGSLEGVWEGSNRVFLQIPEYNTHASNKASQGLTVAVNAPDLFGDKVGFATTASAFSLRKGIYNLGHSDSFNNADNTIGAYDTSVYHGDGSLNNRYQDEGIITGTAAKITGLMYANHLRKVKVENCNGPIYIRNFCVDGGTHTGGVATHSTDTGFEINNSNVVLENCAVMRCKNAGAEFNNSNVILNRGFITYRNYETSSTTRNKQEVGAGLRANNSVVTLSSTDDLQLGQGVDSPMVAAYNDVGWEFNNSTLKGGRNRGKAFAASGNPSFALDGEKTRMLFLYANNNKVGILADKSLIDTKARYVVFNNHVGIEGSNSKVNIREMTIDHNQVGIKLDNSKVVYNPDLWSITGSNLNEIAIGQFVCSSNGQHLVLDNNSSFGPKYAVSSLVQGDVREGGGFAGSSVGMPEMYGKFKLYKSNGSVKVGPGLRLSLPGVEIINSSKLDLVHAESTTEDAARFSLPTAQAAAVFGAGYSVRNNSSLRLNGSKNATSIVKGPTETDHEAAPKKVAGVYVDNNSKALFCGPTIISQFGVDVLADNHSTAEFTPHQHETSRLYDPSGWNLSDAGNHTKVELHSYRSCLVADNNSNIVMEDLGDYHAFWDASSIGTADPAVGYTDYNALDDLALSAHCTSGYVQFYPNPQSTVHTLSVARSVGPTTDTTSSLVGGTGPIGNPALHRSISYGGVCVRALNGSKVKVMNVHFPAGWENASSVFYDASDLCGRLYIWNIDDKSYLNSTYTSVHATYPSIAAYHGPSACYPLTGGQGNLGEGPDSIGAASGAPSSTPDTSTLSVLDSFGASSASRGPDNYQPGFEGVLGTYGKSSFQNRGPFRLFFSPRGPSKFLAYSEHPDDLRYGAPYQTLAQGYNLSGDVSSVGFDVSSEGGWDTSKNSIYQSLYPSLKGFQGATAGAPSGPGEQGAIYGGDYSRNSAASSFFYPSEVLDLGYKSRIILDESSMNTFANAKNATTGTSGRPVLVTYYRSIKTAQGEAYDSNEIGYGIGFLSASEFDLRRDN